MKILGSFLHDESYVERVATDIHLLYNSSMSFEMPEETGVYSTHTLDPTDPEMGGIYEGIGSPGIDTLSTAGELVEHIAAHPERYDFHVMGTFYVLRRYEIIDEVAARLSNYYPSLGAHYAEIRQKWPVEADEETVPVQYPSEGWDRQPLTTDDLGFLLGENTGYIDHVLRGEVVSDEQFSPAEARLMIAGGEYYAGLVADHAARFSGLTANRQLANYIIAQGSATAVLQHLPSFEGVAGDEALLGAVIAQGRAYDIPAHAQHLSVACDEKLALRIAQAGGALSVYRQWATFSTAPPGRELAEVLIAQHYGHELMRKDGLYAGTQYDAGIARQLVANGQAWVVYDHVDRFEGVEQTAQLAAQVVAEGFGTYMLRRIDGPEGIERRPCRCLRPGLRGQRGDQCDAHPVTRNT